MDQDSAHDFADSWARAWNAHDLEAVLDLFADDAVFNSPAAAQLVPGSDGIVRGRTALRDYWAEGLRRIPDLHFEVLGCYVGIGIIVINFRNQAGQLVNEVLVIGADGLVIHGYGTYLGDDVRRTGSGT